MCLRSYSFLTVRHKIEKKLFDPAHIARWTVVIFESENRVPRNVAAGVVRDFIGGCQSVGE